MVRALNERLIEGLRIPNFITVPLFRLGMPCSHPVLPATAPSTTPNELKSDFSRIWTTGNAKPVGMALPDVLDAQGIAQSSDVSVGIDVILCVLNFMFTIKDEC